MPTTSGVPMRRFSQSRIGEVSSTLNRSLVRIRQANVDDILSIISLERESSSAAHWTEQQYRDVFTTESEPVSRLVLVAESTSDTRVESALVGCLIARHLAPEWELENIVVAPAARRMGLGKRLLACLLDSARETHSTAVFLEVRESNLAARGLYLKLGFRETGRRKSYYTSPLEDAILYSFTLR